MLQTLETWRRRVWIDRSEAAIDEMLEVDTCAHGLGSQTLVGPDGFKAFHRTLCALLTDTDLVIDHAIEADGWLAALCTFKGTTLDGQPLKLAENDRLSRDVAERLEDRANVRRYRVMKADRFGDPPQPAGRIDGSARPQIIEKSAIHECTHESKAGRSRQR